MKHGSLFAGIGGFDLGFERAGIETIWTVEKDDKCNQVLAEHWPDVERLSDVRECGRHNLRPVDIISGGFPCQDLSVAGRREGLAGERSGLWFEFARIVEEMEPRWVVVENVPGLLSSAGGADFARIIGTLEWFGYCVAWRVLDSQYFGVPQRRRRVFIVGSLGNAGAIEVLFEQEGGGGDIEAGKEEGKRVASAITKSFAKHHGRSAGKDSLPRNAVVCAVSSKWAKGSGGPSGDEAYNLVAYGGNRTSGSVNVTTGVNPHPGNRGFESETYLVSTEGIEDEIAAFTFSQQATGMAWESNRHPSLQAHPQSDTSQRQMGIREPMGVRRLTPTECERLQGFPDGWTEGLSDTARYKCLGNAVTVNVAEWIGRRLVKA